MLFNSYEFIFGFLPVTVVFFFIAGTRSPRLALAWLTVASLFFYAWWRPVNVLIIGPSLAVNYIIARTLLGMSTGGRQPAGARWLLAVGIVFNLAFLGYFKYANFAATVYTDLTGTRFLLEQVILPLGISFITFQKIAFLVDVHSQRIKSFSFGDYCLFVLFFPQLIAGPIVHYREMMPQFHAATCRPNGTDLAVGMTLFVIGLFKKVVLADGVAAYVTPVFAAAASGESVSMFPAWIAAIGFTLQIYFDFSGYSDMALGLARLFGVRLPVNFDSPLKARSIIDFWLRWHITLTRFLTAYIYNPLVMSLTRRRLTRRLPVLGGRQHSPGAFVQLLAGPTLITMLISGAWHGAGYMFILWGLMHGLYLIVNHGWRIYGAPRFAAPGAAGPLWRSGAFLLTFLAVVAAMVVFRAPTPDSAMEIFRGMVGGSGVSLPPHVVARLPSLAGSLSTLSVSSGELERTLVPAFAWIGSLLVIALALPNSLQFTARFEPAIAFKPGPSILPLLRAQALWRPTVPWAAAVVVLAAAVIIRIGGKSEFLYWQF